MTNFDENSLSFIQKDINLNGIELTLVTHQQDQVHGKMFRGGFPICTAFLAELEVLQESIKPNHQVIDAGANIGAVAMVLAKTEPSATIYCFEPDNLNFKILNMNIALNRLQNIKSYNYALGKKREFINMYLSTNNFGDHRTVKSTKNSLHEDSFIKSDTKVLKVNPFEFFEELFGLNAPKSIDLVKIDTQGADFEILESCIPLLKEDAIVEIEYSPYHLEINGIDKKHITAILSNFSSVRKINRMGTLPRLSNIDIPSLLKFYDQHYQYYKTEYNLVLSNCP